MEKRETLAEIGKIPDLKDRKVFDSNEVEIGFVDRMVYTHELNALKYLEISLYYNAEDEIKLKHVLIPVGMAFLKDGNVYLKDIEKDVLLACPEFTGYELTDEYEEALIECLVPQPGKIARNPDEYFHFEHFFTS